LFDLFLPIHTARWAESGHTLRRGQSSIYGLRFVSNRFPIIQQYFVTGWGGLRPPAALVPAPAPALQTVSLSAKSDEEG
jgi:hypothetical protein